MRKEEKGPGKPLWHGTDLNLGELMVLRVLARRLGRTRSFDVVDECVHVDFNNRILREQPPETILGIADSLAEKGIFESEGGGEYSITEYGWACWEACDRLFQGDANKRPKRTSGHRQGARGVPTGRVRGKEA